jgi:4-hydroxy-tetrahydrodipicolinate synthase
MTENGPHINGVVGTCLTPFKADGGIDFAALRLEIEYLVELCRVDAVAIAATEDAEYAVLSWQQRKELMASGTEMVGRRVPVIVGISHPAPERALELAEHARAVKADVVQLLLPIRLWGGDPDLDELSGYVSQVAAHSPLPVALYHCKGPGADPPLQFFVWLADLSNVAYVVETSGDLTRIGRLVEEIERPGNAQYFTTIESLLINLTMGGSGAEMPPPAAYVGAQVVRAFRAGDMDQAVRWQRILGPFPGRWARHGLPPVMKAAMRHLGIDLGNPAFPFGSLTPWDDAVIGQFLEEVGLKERGERTRL